MKTYLSLCSLSIKSVGGTFVFEELTLLPMMARTSSSGEVGVPEMSGLLLLRLRERFRLRLAGRTAERAMVA